ncbi:MAG: RagB/SusD protein [Mucilaginibacter sp.]|nr:RagB/SusD protein [Mucilaginibacter sp.]
MKTRYIYIIIAGILGVTSCKKDFLTNPPPTAVPVSSAINSVNSMTDAVNGMYSSMRMTSLFGRDISVMGDLMADNAYLSFTNSSKYLQENNYTFNNITPEVINIWTQGYFSILQANRIINSNLTADATVNQLRGEAYTVRGLVYLELVNFFATSATVNNAAPGVPIVKAFTTPFIMPSRNMVGEVYKQIISDLDSAYNLMPDAPIAANYHATNSEYLAKYAARAIQARAYLYEGDYVNALAASLDVIKNGGYSLAAPAAFNAYWANPAPQAGKLETIFELALNTQTNNGTNGLDGIYSQSGFGDLLCTDPLYASYSLTDVRKSLIINGKRSGQPALIVNKYPNYTLSTDKDDIKIIRYAEVLLTAAEAYARTSDNTNALLYLNQVAQKRDPAFGGYTGTATIDNIITERQKELAFEGLRYFDLARTNVVINRPVQPFSYASIATIPVGDHRRILPIPLAEINANNNLIPNPGY